MSVGIMDADMALYTLVPFNLEVMKLSAYYKQKREIVVISPSFNPERNSKFFYRKDYNDGIYPHDLTEYNNVEYGGLAFSNNKYIAMPREIEIMKPDTSIYEKMEDVILRCKHPQTKKIYNNMFTAEHCRISLDGKTVWSEYPKQFKSLSSCRNLMLHDYNLAAIDGGFETVQHILKYARHDGNTTKIGMKFPVQVTDGQTLLNWSSLNPNSTFYSLTYVGVIDADAFNEWVGVQRAKAVFTQMDYIVTAPWYEENHFIQDLLPEILKQVIISRTYRVFFTLKYERDFFVDKRWCDVIDLLNFYHNSYASQPHDAYYQIIGDDTLFNFAQNTTNKTNNYAGTIMTRDKIREVFRFVRENHPTLFTMFYECSSKSLGGKI